MKIGRHTIGAGHPCFIVSEIGIGHNGSENNLRKMVAIAGEAGCQAVKGQKRTVDAVYSAAELAQPREGPWGKTNGDLKRLLELPNEAHERAMRQAESLGMTWSCSPWDLASVEVLGDLGVEWVKIASASITDRDLVRACGDLGVPVIMSTGMSDTAEIDRAVEWVVSSKAPALALLHTCSTYPAAIADLHLARMDWLRTRFGCVVGYSGHETGVAPSVEAVRLGASIVERHVTLDRSMWGSDQAASLEPGGLRVLVRAIRWLEQYGDRADPASTSDAVAFAEIHEVLEKAHRNRKLAREATGNGGPREVLASEVAVRAKLRRVT